jgi:hypothetical protein
MEWKKTKKEENKNKWEKEWNKKVFYLVVVVVEVERQNNFKEVTNYFRTIKYSYLVGHGDDQIIFFHNDFHQNQKQCKPFQVQDLGREQQVIVLELNHKDNPSSQFYKKQRRNKKIDSRISTSREGQ